MIHLLFAQDYMEGQCELHGVYRDLGLAKAALARKMSRKVKHITYFIKSKELEDAEVSAGGHEGVQAGQASLGL